MVSRLGTDAVPYISSALSPSVLAYAPSAEQNSSRNYSRSEVVKLLQDKSPSLFMADVGEIILASYRSHDDVLSIFVANKQDVGPRRRLVPNDPLVQYFKSLKAADLFIQDCGEPFGKDEHCDQYSILNEPALFGSKITGSPEAIQRRQDLLNKMGEVLSVERK